jgi:hypothetical protein
MTTLKIKVSDKILDKFLWLLQQFKSEDIEVIDENFESNKNEVHLAYQNMKDSNDKTYSIEELDELLESRIKKYEA